MNTKQTINTALLSLLILAGCQQNDATATSAEKLHSAAHPQAASVNEFSGTVQETFDASGYTYAQIKTDKGPVWAAGPVSSVKKGDNIRFSGQMPMANFHSKSLNRDFDIIYFVSGFTINDIAPQTAKLDPHTKSGDKQPVTITLKSFDKAKNGQTIAEILENKSRLNNKPVSVRGQVTKFTAGVMGKNWIHIRDSSSEKDLTITTSNKAELNDIILLEGQLALNKDFGYGYIYDVIVEEAKVSVE